MATAGKDFLTLNDYWQTRSYTLRLKCKDGTASPEIESGPTNRPTYYLGSKPEILLDNLDSIPLVHANDLSAIRGTESLRTLPPKVRDVRGTIHRFKPCPAVQGQSFFPELDALKQLHQLGLERDIRTPRLTGIVVADDGASPIGLLSEWVGHSTLADTARQEDIKNHEKWRRQVMDAVAVLHAHDFVWGAVSPYNILIDEGGDAFIQGLGLMYNSHLIDKDIADTKVGDLECLRLLFDEWLVAQEPWRPMPEWKV